MTNNKENIDKVAFLKTIKTAIIDPEFIYSAYYLGTPRKIKRVLNALVMSNLYGRIGSFKDRVNEELLYLLLLYIYHPEIFRDIFNYETNGKRGYFSLITTYDLTLQNKLGEDRFHERDTIKQFNSKHFYNYVKKVNSPEAVFLLKKLFDVEQKFTGWKTSDYTSLGEDQKASWACFNGSADTPKNLEDYLKFITDSSYEPSAGSQRATYAEQVGDLLNSSTDFKTLLQGDFYKDDLEEKVEKLLEVYFNETGRFGADLTEAQIEGMIFSLIEIRNKIAYYSIKKSVEENEDFFAKGYRKSLDYRLVRLVEMGYYAQGDKWSYNKWVEKIIFGDDNLFIRMLQDKSVNPIMNLNDLLSFRLYLCIDRGGQNHRIGGALYDLYLNQEGVDISHSYDQDFLMNEMRGVSQYIYSLIESELIQQKVSIFKLYEDISLKDVDPEYKSGDYYDEDAFLRLKERLLSFVLYQISCVENSWGSGLAMGLYDLSGNKDLRGIQISFTKYLLNNFNQNYEHYWHYLSISGGRRFIDDDRKLKYSDKPLFAVTNRELFIKFSNENKVALVESFPNKKLSIQGEVVDLTIDENKAQLMDFFNEICELGD